MRKLSMIGYLLSIVIPVFHEGIAVRRFEEKCCPFVSSILAATRIRTTSSVSNMGLIVFQTELNKASSIESRECAMFDVQRDTARCSWLIYARV